MDNPHANTDHDMEKEMLRMENEKLRKELQIALGRLQQSQESGETEGEQQKREDAAGGDEKRKREEGRYDIEDWKKRREDGDGNLMATPVNNQKRKSVHFTMLEDQALCNAWVKNSEDAVNGKCQTSGGFWNRVVVDFHQHLPNVERSIDSLTGRWKHIKKHVTKFTAIMNQVENQRPSGASIEDQLSIARTKFQHEERTAFALDHCWCILKDNPKWNSALETKSSKTPVRRHRRRSLEDASSNDSTPISLDEEATLPSTPLNATVMLQEGRSNENEKMEKNGGSMAVTEVSLSCKEDKISNKDTDLEAAKISNQLKLRNLDILQREVEAREEENRIRQMNFEVKLLAMNTTVLDPATALLIKKRQAKIRASWEQEDYDGTEF
ncbi:hypothetical protein IFM89_014883 [Coptis chinensis]|uniref:No apical meristem-associated C-terminal domain-containing protein n=1 Tax=Coptis chinensis TaxID=261450 RepID=A0A835HF68_9MAGN|nr:hypothetical protein IFM89_014883 [Coptis chinensis]